VKLNVNYTLGGDLTVTDNEGHVRRVNPDNCNILTRQYYFNGKTLKGDGSEATSQIYSSAYAVIHQIDGVLQPSTNCYYSPEAYAKVYEIIEAHPFTEPTPEPTPTPIKRRR
jgi:hypothetical protein